MSIFRKSYKDRSGQSRRTKTFYVEFRDHRGDAHVVSGFRDKDATLTLERKLERLAAFRASGGAPDVRLRRWIESLAPALRARLAALDLITARQVAALRPLDELIDEWAGHLRAKGTTEDHVKLVRSRAARVLAGTGATFWNELNSGRVEQYLRGERERAGGISARTSNFYLQATRQFCRWAVRRGLATEDPLRILEPLDAERDRRRRRRALTVPELARLLSATAAAPMRDRLSGPERSLIYRIAAETGLRRGELICLRVDDCDLRDLDRGSVTVRAANAKNRRDATLPLRRDTAAELVGHLNGRLSSGRVFSMSKSWRAAEALRADLNTAEIPVEDSAGLVVDFHALRTTFGTNLARSGVALQVAQKLMRHSTPLLTANTYTVLGRDDERRAIQALPAMVTASANRAQATGTDSGSAKPVPDLQADLQGESGREPSTSRTERASGEGVRGTPDGLESQQNAGSQARWREHIGIEPTHRGSPDAPVLKTGGPTRYPAAPAVRGAQHDRPHPARQLAIARREILGGSGGASARASVDIMRGIRTVR